MTMYYVLFMEHSAGAVLSDSRPGFCKQENNGKKV